MTLPLAMPGLVSGALLVFAYNASAFAVPLLLGGRRVPMLAVLVHDRSHRCSTGPPRRHPASC